MDSRAIELYTMDPSSIDGSSCLSCGICLLLMNSASLVLRSPVDLGVPNGLPLYPQSIPGLLYFHINTPPLWREIDNSSLRQFEICKDWVIDGVEQTIWGTAEFAGSFVVITEALARRKAGSTKVGSLAQFRVRWTDGTTTKEAGTNWVVAHLSRSLPDMH